MYDCLKIENGRLHIGGADTVEIASEYGTPAYVLSEDYIRRVCGIYVSAMKEAFAPGSMPLYASKACSFAEMYRIVGSEGMGADTVSPGEIYTAEKAGFDMSKTFFHGNNKTDEDILFAVRHRVGRIVADSMEELDAIDSICGRLSVKQRVLLRLTPGIDPHTFKAVSTGIVDSKFGMAITNGAAEKLLRHALGKKNITVEGFHCHIGSQVWDAEHYSEAAERMISFAAEMKEKLGYTPEYLNLGGGFAVPYTSDEKMPDYRAQILSIGKSVKALSEKYSVKEPKILLEPGRSIVAAAGITLYTVGTVKEIEGVRNYVSIDGGMTDNPRFALYGSVYEATKCDGADKPRDYKCTIAGRCCESGDIIGENMMIQKPKRGDVIAVFTTGAYNYSMASNYNRIPRPPVIVVKDGRARVAVARESYDDLVRNDI